MDAPAQDPLDLRTRRALGARIARLRRERGLKQPALARALGVTPEVVSRYERGRYLPRLRVLLELRRLFSVSLDYLVVGSPTRIADLRLQKLAREADQLPPDRRDLVVHALASLVEGVNREVRPGARPGAGP